MKLLVEKLVVKFLHFFCYYGCKHPYFLTWVLQKILQLGLSSTGGKSHRVNREFWDLFLSISVFGLSPVAVLTQLRIKNPIFGGDELSEQPVALSLESFKELYLPTTGLKFCL